MISADVDLIVSKKDSGHINSLSENISVSNKKDSVFFSLEDIEIIDWDIFNRSVLELIQEVFSVLKKDDSPTIALRIGVYYDLSETVIFPFKLSPEVVIALAATVCRLISLVTRALREMCRAQFYRRIPKFKSQVQFSEPKR